MNGNSLEETVKHAEQVEIRLVDMITKLSMREQLDLIEYLKDKYNEAKND